MKKMVFIPIILWVSNGFFIEYLVKIWWAYFLVDILSYVFIPLGCLYGLNKLYNVSPIKYGIDIGSFKPGFNGKEKFTDYLQTILILCSIYFVLWFIGVYFDLYDKGIYNELDYEFGKLQTYLFVFYLSFTAAVFEEIFYRGLIFYIVKKYIEDKESMLFKLVYVLGSSIIFGVAHFEYSTYEMITAFIFGSLLAMFFMYEKDLIPLILAHFIIDIFLFA